MKQFANVVKLEKELDGWFQMKKCSKCKETLSLDNFAKDIRNTADGHQSFCRPCQSTYYKAYNASRRDADAAVSVTSKVCRDCGLTKPISQFGKKSVSLDKHNIYCKPCWRTRTQIATRKMMQRAH